MKIERHYQMPEPDEVPLSSPYGAESGLTRFTVALTAGLIGYLILSSIGAV